MSQNIDLYTGPHKGQRNYIYRLSTIAGRLDANDHESIKEYISQFKALRDEFALHAELEEKHIHPIISKRIPGIVQILEEDHANQKAFFNELVGNLEDLNMIPEYEEQQSIFLEFYRAFNRYIAMYLQHINFEEMEIQSALWRVCSHDELSKTMSAIIAHQKPGELQFNLEMMFSSMTAAEVSALIAAARTRMPQDAVTNVYGLAERVMDTAEWNKVKTRLGLH
jgi:hemerythrin-like domain-containing protein